MVLLTYEHPMKHAVCFVFQINLKKKLLILLGSGGRVKLSLDLPYTKAVIQEGYRIRTSTPLGVRRATIQDVKLNGYDIPNNTQVK